MRFDYERPSTVEQAVALLADRDRRGIPVAFGSDLLVQTKRRAREPGTVVDLTGIDELRALDEQEDGLFLGAALPLGEIGRAPALARFPALRAAVATMGSAQLREGASIGGNVCTASPAGDSGPPLLAYEARMVLAGPGGRRDLAAGEFYLGPGRCAVETTEVLVGLRLPWPRPGSVGTDLKGARRRAVDLALVSVAAVAWPSSEMPSGLEG